LAKAGIETFVLVTEPDGVSSLIDSVERLKAPMDLVHWASAMPASVGWDGLEDMVRKINSNDQKQLADIKDLGKSNFREPALNFLGQLKDFKCERTGQSYGSITSWDDTRALVIDSLTGWSNIAFGATVGYKPTANPGEWGISQNFINNMLLKINCDRQCFFVLTAHIEKELDDMTGVRKIMVSTIGAKLAPKIMPFFGDVVRCRRAVDANGKADFSWSTLDNEMDLKNRALPPNAKLLPDFLPVVEAYKRRKNLVAATPQAKPEPENVIPLPRTIVPPTAPMSPPPTRP